MYKIIQFMLNSKLNFDRIFRFTKNLKVTKINEQIYLIDMFKVNCYLIVNEKDELLLIDSLYPGQDTHLIKVIHSLGFSLKNLRYHLITHAHIDHVGNSARLSKKFAFTTYINEFEGQKFINNLKTIEKLYNLDGTESPINFMKIKAPAIKSYQLLDEQTVIPGFEFIKPIKLPGHTAGMYGFLINDDYLVCADALRNYKEKILPVLVYNDFQLGLKTIEKIASLKFKTLLPSHGPAYSHSDLKEQINQLLKTEYKKEKNG